MQGTTPAAGVFPTTYSFNRDGVVGSAGAVTTAGGARGSGASKPTIRAKTSTVRRACCGRRSEHSQISQASPRAWTGLARCRAGAGNWLFYGTGGLAYGHVKYSYSNTPTCPSGEQSFWAYSNWSIETRSTAGGGVEYGWNNWSAKSGVGLSPNFQNRGSILHVGLNRFSPRPEANTGPGVRARAEFYLEKGLPSKKSYCRFPLSASAALEIGCVAAKAHIRT